MDIAEYFEVVSTNDRVFHFRLKGFWTDKVAEQIGERFLSLFKNAVDSMDGEKFLALADTSEFKPPYSKAKAAITQTMKYAREHNLHKSVEFMPSAVTQVAVRLAARESGEDDFRVVVTSMEDARAEINRLKQEL